ncbi:MAG: hypothetical protein HY909_28430 [Deltaproteobacteria bacterium]|nr:hypothetical protein [Deltaproteobacteria bacterium]
MVATPSREELLALAGKYDTLLALRGAHDATGEVAPREVLRALAARFPGALRELDRLPLEVLSRRAGALREAAVTGDPAAWMRWLWAFHGALRGALAARRAAGRARGEVGPDALGRLATEASRAAGMALSEGFVRDVCALPGGRLTAVAWRWVEARYGLSAGEARRALLGDEGTRA